MKVIQFRLRGLVLFGLFLFVSLCYILHLHTTSDSPSAHKSEVKKSHKYDKIKKKDKLTDEEILNNDPKLKDALKKLNEHAIEKQVEYRKSKLPPDSDYIRPVMERPIHDPLWDGQKGAAVTIDDKDWSQEKKDERQKLRDRFMIDHMVSERVSLHRDPGEHRHTSCIDLASKGYQYDQLPTTSVIVTFYNEGWTTLLRTLYSILHTSPKALLKEIILIDDLSNITEFPKLGRPLEAEVAKMPRVRLIRTKKREGLVRARLLGAEVAHGEALTFLDCHIECNEGWLEPLLARIAEDDSVVTVPIISTIEWDTFAFRHSPLTIEPQIGGFDWRMTFQWHGIPAEEKKRRKHKTDPVRTPTMAGGLFAVSRNYFRSIGSYDYGMDVWGGENLEMSFRVWMCGGSLEIIPCSIVGHVFPKTAPYERKSFTPNTVRAVEVWLDDYKRHYYARNPLARKENYGDISDRQKLRKELNCKPFEWYLNNIYSDLVVPEDKPGFYGALHNKGASGKCLDYNPPENALTTGIVGTFGCHGQGGNQFFEYNSNLELRYTSQFELCIAKKENSDEIAAVDCSNSDAYVPDRAKWIIIDDQSTKSFQIKNKSNGKCVSVEKHTNGNPKLLFEPCSQSSSAPRYQQWYFVD